MLSPGEAFHYSCFGISRVKDCFERPNPFLRERRGPGVVGEQPVLSPGEAVHRSTSPQLVMP